MATKIKRIISVISLDDTGTTITDTRLSYEEVGILLRVVDWLRRTEYGTLQILRNGGTGHVDVVFSKRDRLKFRQ